MNLTVEIPDDLVGQLNASGGDLSRRALEAFALEEYKSGHITKGEMRRLLGFSTRYELDGFLKVHEVWADYTIDDLHRELQDLQSLGL
jgi:predicted HTH domain antitoxin